MEMYTRKILAWDIDTSTTAKWVTGVAIKVIEQCPDILYLHSDQGCQYTSKLYLTTLLESGDSPSYNSKVYPYHNAWIESFQAIKKEYIYRT